MEELNSVCELELRKYNWSIMPKDVHSPQTYAWKIYILSVLFSQYDTFMWMDTSINLEDKKYLDPIFEGIEKGKISEMVFPGGAVHSLKYAINLRMFTYTPIITDWIKIENQKWDAEMALLCAATKQCIHPDGSEFYCKSPRTTIGSCHRFDQSVMGILNVNSEYKRSLIAAQAKLLNSNGQEAYTYFSV
uniref:Uncharacterized protein n=1 Tax=Meloidogyne javanica TaxID=6303 RepID=A0A915M1M7_MELJA